MRYVHNVFDLSVTDNSDKIGAEFDTAVLRSLEKCGLKGEDYAKQLASVDTGALRSSITHVVVPDEKAVYIGSNQNYAIHVELGTGEYADGGRTTPWVYRDSEGNYHWTRGNEAKPFIKPAVAGHAAGFHRIIESEMKG